MATPINLSALPDGVHTVYVIGRDAAGVWQSALSPTISRSWVVASSLRQVVFNEVLARNDGVINHGGHFPDLIVLYNAGTATVDLGGLRLTDDLNVPDKFMFPSGTTVPPGGYLVLYADDPDGTAGIHLGFSIDQDGETIYLSTLLPADRASSTPLNSVFNCRIFPSDACPMGNGV